MSLFGGGTPVILQMEATECGAACLAMVLAAHGRPITLEEARVACATARDGVDAARLVVAARSFGLETHGLRREPEDLALLPMPLILHWNFDHFVILDRVTRSGFVILDPACGRRVVDRAEFGRSFTGVALSFQPGPGFERRPPRRTTLGLLLDEAWRSPDAIALTALLGLVAIVPALALTAAIGVFADHVVGQSRLAWALALLGAILGAGLLQFGIGVLRERIVAALRSKIATHVAVAGFWRALHLPASFFAQRSAGEIVSRLRLGSSVGEIVGGPLARLVPDGVQALGYLGVMALFSPGLAAVLAVVCCVNLISMTALSRRVAAANAAAQVAEGAAAGIATAGMAALETYRLHGRERLLVERIAAAEDTALDREQRIGVLRAIGLAAPAASGLAMTIAVLTVGAVLVMDGALTLGGLIACQMMAGLINGPVVSLAAAMPHLQEAGGAFARIDDLQRYPLARAFEPDRQAQERQPLRITGHVRLEAVSFGFAPGQPLLRDITLDIPPGRILAILGPSGSGKSTLARLIAGMTEPDAGRVLLDGIGLEDWPQPLLRRTLQYVPQQAAVFSGSLDDNLHLWDHAIRQQDSAQAILRTGLHGVVAARAHGMHSLLSSHSPALSGGEIQRLALARALSRAPGVLVLDETTSALDFAAEADILDQLRLSGATVVIVTHRTGTALRCDDAILLDQGAIVACGAPGAILLRETMAAADPSLPRPDRAEARAAIGAASR